MTITHVLAVALVSDQAEGIDWYTKLLGRRPDSQAMPTLAGRHVTETAWIQVFHDPQRAGSSVFNLPVDVLVAHPISIRGLGSTVGDVVINAKGSRLDAVVDPDGNTITLIQDPVT
ncbi:MAG: VOC family protein [Mycobacterium sp.]